MKNIYLDVDGVILLDDLENAGRGALRLALFLIYLGNLQADGLCRLFWLTTHCKDGSDTKVLTYLKQRLEEHEYDLICRMKIRPATWNELKTDAIDFSQDFLWLDDDAQLQELEVLHTHGMEHKLVEIDLQKNKYQLRDIVYSSMLGNKSFD